MKKYIVKKLYISFYKYFKTFFLSDNGNVTVSVYYDKKFVIQKLYMFKRVKTIKMSSSINIHRCTVSEYMVLNHRILLFNNSKLI